MKKGRQDRIAETLTFGETVYLDRNEIGSGNDLICGNKKADVQMQLRIKF